MKINGNILYRIIQYASICYIVIFSISCIMFIGNDPMEECVQYVLPNTNVQSFANKLKNLMAENSDVQFNPTKLTPYCLYDESILSSICFNDTNEVLLIEAIEHDDDVVVRIGPIQRLEENGSWKKNSYNNVPIAGFSFGKADDFKHGLQIQKAFEECVLERLGEYHKDWIYNYLSIVAYFFYYYLLELPISYLVAVLLLAFSLKMMRKKWKMTSLLLLTVVPFLVLLASLLLAFAAPIFYRNKDVFDAQSRHIYGGNKNIHPLTFLIDKNNPVSDYLNEHQDIDVDYPDMVYGNSLLMFAIINDSPTSAKELLENQANPNYTSPHNGGTPLLKSLQILDSSEKPDTALLSMVLSFGADPNLLTFDKKHERKRIPLLEVRSLEQARMLVEKGDAQVSDDIIHIMELGRDIYPFMNDSVQNQIVTFYKSLLHNDE